MKLEELHDQWEKDSPINTLNLMNESANIGALHSKYWRFLTEEKTKLEHINNRYSKLYEDKFNFFMNGEDEDSRDKGWVLPPKGKCFVKDEAKRLVEIDNDIIDLKLKLSIINAKIDFLESILKLIMNRSYTINNIIQWAKFENGN